LNLKKNTIFDDMKTNRSYIWSWCSYSGNAVKQAIL